MGNSSFTSILILLILFIVLPSVLKFIGQYTLSSKNTDEKKEDREVEVVGPEEIMGDHMEETRYRGNMEVHEETPFPNKPIKPRWF